MSSRHLASGDDVERGRAVLRLRAAIAERKSLDGREPTNPHLTPDPGSGRPPTEAETAVYHDGSPAGRAEHDE